MRLLSLELKNIRSYKHETVTFPDGTVLLAGDIGSGKSTILLAIEFALFGIRRGELSGGALLRHGTKEGSVKLAFSLSAEGKEHTVEIVRSLKRGTTITQESGSLTIDGSKQDLTAVELKAKVLELLNYPEDLLTKGMVFRYTVYTPQEQMKRILLEKPEERLGTFRKLFRIDQYKLIRENAVLYGRDLRAEAARLEGQADDLEAIQKRAKELQEQRKGIDAELKTATTALKEHAPIMKRAEQALENIEQERFAQEERKKAYEVAKARVESFERELQRVESEIADAKELMIKLPSAEEIEKQHAEIAKGMQALEKQERELAEKTEALMSKRAKFGAIADRENAVTEKIESLTTCPTCKQEVTETHKHAITATAKAVVEKAEQQRSKAEDELDALKAAGDTCKAKRQELRRAETELSVMKEKMSAQKVREQQHANRLKRKEQVTEALENARKEVSEKKAQVKETDPSVYADAKKALEKARTAQQELALRQARLQEQSAAAEKDLSGVAERIAERQAAAAEAVRLGRLHSWLTKHFVNVMYTIEKHVLMSIYHLFNDAFKEWFSLLIEDENLSVRLGDDFSPLIEQNGYETTVEHLSGGERTAVALAYRLALNGVINKALQHIRTQDLLILDEPTEGFSSEQLDRVKEVFSRLGLQQVILVSHDPKMESFVDHILRVVKSEHESKVL